MKAKKPTIDDVARVAGVGRATVSRVMNGGSHVRDEVRERVRRAVEELDYRVNPQARSLAGGASRMLALVLGSDLEAEPNSFYASALELGALRECLARGYHLIVRHVPQNDYRPRPHLEDLVTTHRCQGVILTPPFADDPDLIAFLKSRGVEVVLVSPGGAGRDLADGVGIDDEAGGYDIARRLLDLGHRRFGYIGGIEGHLSAEQRLDGVRRALAERGLGDEAVQVARGDFTFRSGALLASRFLDAVEPPTSLICANDDMAAGALSTAHGRNLDVPADLSITGFDDTPVSEIVWPPLTTVHQPLKEMARRAVGRLADRLSGAATGEGVFERMDHAVVSRGSAGRVRPSLSAATG